MSSRLGRLKTRPEFLRVAAVGRRWATPGLVLQAAPALPASTAIRFGLTASRKVGGAVERNRVRRRLRALAEVELATAGQGGTDYVLIGRAATVQRAFPLLRRDLRQALERVQRSQARGG